MSFDINREILYFRHSLSASSELDGLERCVAERPASMEESDFNTLLNFFRTINDEVRSDGERYSNDTLMNNNLHFFCFKSGAAMFKITPCPAVPSAPELYGYFFAAEDVRTAWLYAGKLCFVLSADPPKTGKKGKFSEDKLAGLEIDSIKGLHETFKSSLSDLAKKLASRSFPANFALSCLPDDFYPKGVTVYESGFIPMKTNTKNTDVVVEFDDNALAGMINACREPLKTAVLISSEEDDSDDFPVEVKKVGLFGKLKKEKPTVEVREKQVKRWKYEFLGAVGKRSESCDFIRVNEPVEYSPVSDTFYAYNEIVANESKEAMYPKPPAAKIYVPSSLKPLAPLPVPAPEPESAPALTPIPEIALTPPRAEPIQSAKPALEPVSPVKLMTPPMPVPVPKPAPPPPPVPKPATVAMPAPPPAPVPKPAPPPPPPKPVVIEPMRKPGKQRPASAAPGKSFQPGKVEMPSFDDERGLPTFGRSKADMSAVESMTPLATKIYGQQMPEPVKMPELVKMPEPEPPFTKHEPPFTETEPEPEPMFTEIEPEPLFTEPEPEPVPEPIKLTPFIHKKPEPEPEYEFDEPDFEPIFEMPIPTSKLPPPPAPVTLDTLSTWNSSSAQIIHETETSGEMDAVALKPKSMNPALELYYRSQKNNNT